MDSFLKNPSSHFRPIFSSRFFSLKGGSGDEFPQGLRFILPNPRDRVSGNNFDRNPFLGSQPVFHGFSFRTGLFSKPSRESETPEEKKIS